MLTNTLATLLVVFVTVISSASAAEPLFVATFASPFELRVIDSSSGQALTVPSTGRNVPLSMAAVSGKVFVLASDDLGWDGPRYLLAFDAATGRLLQSVPMGRSVSNIVSSGDGRYVMFQSDGDLVAVDARTLARTEKRLSCHGQRLVIHPDGDTLLVLCYSELLHVSIGRLEELRSVALTPSVSATAAVISPDGATLYTIGNAIDGTPLVYSVAATSTMSGHIRWHREVAMRGRELAISPDGRTLYAGFADDPSHRELQIMESALGTVLGSLDVEVRRLVIAPDGRTGYAADFSGQLTRLDLQARRAVDTLTAAGRVWEMAFEEMVTAEPFAVEFFHEGLDHYFVTADAGEVAMLDAGGLPGWKRTGYGMPTGGAAFVCRFYAGPSSGINSHFYSASPSECAAVSQGLADTWALETLEAFRMSLPDVTNGNCPEGMRPVYRSWNNRHDSNHRYTMDLAVHESMVSKGHIAEGYGNPPVAMCAP